MGLKRAFCPLASDVEPQWQAQRRWHQLPKLEFLGAHIAQTVHTHQNWNVD